MKTILKLINMTRLFFSFKKKGKPKTGVFVMNAETAMEFYQRCIDKNAITDEERGCILAELAKEGKVDRAYTTKRSIEQFVKDLAKNYRVLRVKNKEK